MSHTLEKAARCTQCRAPMAQPAPGPADPAVAFQVEVHRYDLEALAVEASADKAYDESAKVRATQEDIQNLLAKRRGTR